MDLLRDVMSTLFWAEPPIFSFLLPKNPIKPAPKFSSKNNRESVLGLEISTAMCYGKRFLRKLLAL